MTQLSDVVRRVAAIAVAGFRAVHLQCLPRKLLLGVLHHQESSSWPTSHKCSQEIRDVWRARDEVPLKLWKPETTLLKVLDEVGYAEWVAVKLHV